MHEQEPAREQEISSDLPSWDEVKATHEWGAILIGNGASRAVWEGFSYRSLFQTAKDDIEHPLTPEDQSLFQAFGAENFETILAALSSARKVDAALGRAPEELDTRYESIRHALIEAVHAVHVPWNSVSDEGLQQIRDAMLEYQYAFTTNYDLISYWADMEGDPSDIKDFFWNPDCVFDPGDTEVWTKSTRLFFLHGGLHLLRLTSGQAQKRRAVAFKDLLDLFGNPPGDDPDATPLVITEGSANEKLASIRSSNYLTFAYESFRSVQGPAVVFGHSLSDGDAHILDVMKEWEARPIAVSIRPFHSPDEIRSRKAAVIHKLPQADLHFFNSETHPLGDSQLRAE
jgi:Domain of unknown function (DUF4917)